MNTAYMSISTNRGPSEYKENQFSTVDRGKILLMMYDGAIRFIQEAKYRMDKHDKSGQGVFIGKAINVISELNTSLNKEAGGEIAISLERLYNYITRELTNSNIKNITQPLDVCIRILNNLKEAWAEVVHKIPSP